MSKRFSLSALMHNRKAMIIFSLLAAIAIWGAVIYGGSADEERVLRVSVPVDLTGTYADQVGMRIIGESTFDVQVRVQGRFSVISQLTAEDIRVRVDTGTIFRTGKQTLSVTASRNSAETDYTITSCFPNTVTVTCDYWDTGLSFKVGVDTGGVKVADESQHRLGDAIPDSSLLPDGSVTLEGPRSVTSQIASIVARISDSAAISETTVFSAELVALDADGKEVDLSDCRFTDLTSTTVNVTVPVWVSRTVDFSCALQNVPAALKNRKDLVTVSPASIVIVGPQSDVDTFAESIQQISTVDFDHLSPDNLTQRVALNVPSSVQILDNTTEVTVKVNLSGYTSRSFTLNVGTAAKNVTVSGIPEGMTADVPTQAVTFTVVGEKKVLDRLTEKSFSGRIALGDSPSAGMNRYTLRIQMSSAGNSWIYYGEDAAGISVYVTLKS